MNHRKPPHPYEDIYELKRINPSEYRRIVHLRSENKRRNQINYAIEDLQKQIEEVLPVSQGVSSKVAIVRAAIKYIDILEYDIKSLTVKPCPTTMK